MALYRELLLLRRDDGFESLIHRYSSFEYSNSPLALLTHLMRSSRMSALPGVPPQGNPVQWYKVIQLPRW